MPNNEENNKSKPPSKSTKEENVVPRVDPDIPIPWNMLCLAAVFDLIGLIPIVNFISESLAGLIFGMWQKVYVPQLDPLMTFIVAKIIDALSLGILPSNIGIVVYAYIRKKSLAAIYTPEGFAMGNKILAQKKD